MRVLRVALDGTLVRASALLVHLASGEYLNVRRDELTFTSPPPREWPQGEVYGRVLAVDGKAVQGAADQRRAPGGRARRGPSGHHLQAEAGGGLKQQAAAADARAPDA